MEQLRESINALRRKNYQGRYFVPEDALFRLLQRDKIREALKGKTQHYELEELVEIIFSGARKIFAILVLNHYEQYITRFVEHDQLQSTQSPLDHKLPFELEPLQILMTPGHAQLFDEKQWEFTAPVFTPSVLRRSLKFDTILPFIKEKEVGTGGFGTVYTIEIEPSHQIFDPSIKVSCYLSKLIFF